MRVCYTLHLIGTVTSDHTNFSLDYQAPSDDPPCFRSIKETISITTDNCFPPPEKFNGSPGSGNSSIYSTRAAWQLCSAIRCKTCFIQWATEKLSSHASVEVFEMKIKASCKSSNIIYLITCRRCGQNYVGKTGQLLHHRRNGHCHDIMQGRTEVSPVADF